MVDFSEVLWTPVLRSLRRTFSRVRAEASKPGGQHCMKLEYPSDVVEAQETPQRLTVHHARLDSK